MFHLTILYELVQLFQSAFVYILNACYNYGEVFMKKIYYYDDFDSDVVKSKNQEYVLKTNYKWINKNIFYVIWSYVIYWIFL